MKKSMKRLFRDQLPERQKPTAGLYMLGAYIQPLNLRQPVSYLNTQGGKLRMPMKSFFKRFQPDMID